MSHNSPDTSLRVFNAIYIMGKYFKSGVGKRRLPNTYLEAFHTDLYLSADEEDVQSGNRLRHCGRNHMLRRDQGKPGVREKFLRSG